MGQFLARRWRQQPTGRVAIADTERSRMAAACIFNDIGSGFPNDLITGKRLAISGGKVSAGGKYGRARRFTSTTDYIDFGSELTISGSGIVVPFTIIYGSRKIDATLRSSVAFGHADALLPVSESRLAAHAPYSDGTVYFYCGGTTDGVNAVQASGLTFSDDVWCFTTGVGGMQIWQNAVLRNSNASQPERALAGFNFRLGYGFGSSEGITPDIVDISFCYIWNKQLSRDEIIERSTNPYAIAMSSSRRMYFGATAAFKPAWAVNANTVIQSGIRAA